MFSVSIKSPHHSQRSKQLLGKVGGKGMELKSCKEGSFTPSSLCPAGWWPGSYWSLLLARGKYLSPFQLYHYPTQQLPCHSVLCQILSLHLLSLTMDFWSLYQRYGEVVDRLKEDARLLFACCRVEALPSQPLWERQAGATTVRALGRTCLLLLGLW